MTAPENQAAAAELRTWGVWDEHDRRWVADGYASEREAWAALVSEVESLHPRELVLKQSDPPLSLVESADDEVQCPKCDGDGVCWNCDAECSECDCYGTIPVRRMRELEDEERRRKDAIAEMRSRRARGAVA